MIEVTMYKCDYCNKKLASKKAIEKHEKQCFYNSKNRTCLTCKYYYKANINKCIKLDKELDYKDLIINCKSYAEGNFNEFVEEEL